MRLTIRPEQKSVIEAVAQENFVRRIALHLLEQYPRAVVRLPDGSEAAVEELSDEVLSSLVRGGIGRARGYELEFESSIAAFVAVMFEVSPNFDKHRLCQVLLKDEEVEPENRLEELLDVLSEKNWESVRAEYDPQAWKEAEPESEERAPVTGELEKDQSKPNDSDLQQTVKV